jgi:hypothetical protein
MLTGCIPIYMPPTLDSASRGNVPQEPPASINVGKSSRTDVLLLLGEPDGRAQDDSWFTYGMTHTWGVGGVLIVGGWGTAGAVGGTVGSQTARRLVVRFDGEGLVAAVDASTRKCGHGEGFAAEIGSGDGSALSKDCLDATGQDLNRVSGAVDPELAAFLPDPGVLIERYEMALLVQHPYPDCDFPHTRYYRSGALYVTSRALIQPSATDIYGAAAGTTVVPFSDVAEVLPLQQHDLMQWIVLQRNDHGCVFVRSGNRKEVMERTRQQIIGQIHALSAGSTTP